MDVVYYVHRGRSRLLSSYRLTGQRAGYTILKSRWWRPTAYLERRVKWQRHRSLEGSSSGLVRSI
jgi:hypothetical protein